MSSKEKSFTASRQWEHGLKQGWLRVFVSVRGDRSSPMDDLSEEKQRTCHHEDEQHKSMSRLIRESVVNRVSSKGQVDGTTLHMDESKLNEKMTVG